MNNQYNSSNESSTFSNQIFQNNQDLFKKIEEEKKQKETKEEDFISSLPNWDLPPLYEKVRRVVR